MTDQPTPPTCPDCGTALPADSPQALCPACLLRQALASRTIDSPDPTPAAPPLSPEEIADKFPQFEITECLGRGGMGVVYKARQKSLNRWVAIKILAPERVGDPKFAERFTREAQTLAQLNHPNIVTVYDYGETDGLYYIVMEFVDGVNLRDLLRDGQLSADQALKIVPPVCEALQFAHDRGIVHRDIKPENLLLDHDGRLKIADFGIAAMIGSTGEASGTPPYMAPEQGGATTNVDHRADIYALGAVLYEALTGERPDAPLHPPSQKVQIDIRIDDIVLRALSTEPERRYRTADQFRTMVETVVASSGTPATTPATPSTSTPTKAPDHPWNRVAAILLIVVGAINLLSLAFSLLIVPIASALFGRLSSTPFFQPDIYDSAVQQTTTRSIFSGFPIETFPSGFLSFALIGIAFLFTLTVAILTLLGGRHMLRGTSRKMALTGAIACCLTPLWWPLGLLAGVFALGVLLMDSAPTTATAVSGTTAAKPSGPRLSGMALTAAILQFLSFGGGLLVFFLMSYLVLTPADGPDGPGGITFAPNSFIFIFLLLFALPGLILGWISAGHIRNSAGKLTGLGLAKFAVMTPLVMVSLLFLALSVRLSAALVATQITLPDPATTSIAGIIGALTALFLLACLLTACSRHLSGTPKPDRHRLRTIAALLLIVLWLGLSLLLYLQRPEQIDTPLAAHSPDQRYSATVSTRHHRRAFSPDLFTYHLDLQRHDTNTHQTWDIPNTNYTTPPTEFHFADHGRIVWSPDSKSVMLFLNDIPIFHTGETEHPNRHDAPIPTASSGETGPLKMREIPLSPTPEAETPQ